jgi:hypothetical protein
LAPRDRQLLRKRGWAAADRPTTTLIQVTGNDPHDLDRDGNGIGIACE